MMLIAESGSTKTDWRLVLPNGDVRSHMSEGFNPVLHTSAAIETSLKSVFAEGWRHEVKQIFFYGPACINGARCAIVRLGLQPIFEHADIEVNHDMLAACRATSQNKAGLVCILGTGSNSCLYDGNKIIDRPISLGYLLGDEGSGFDIGAQLIRSYCYDLLSAETSAAVFEQFGFSKAEIVAAVYAQDYPNRYVASFAQFVIERAFEHSDCRGILEAGFAAFVKHFVLRYDLKPSDFPPIHLVGSVAHYAFEYLQAAFRNVGLDIASCTQSPGDGLLKYHKYASL